MHPFKLPKAVTERIMTRRGKLHIYENLEPARTALLVIDMQNNFLQEGALSEVPVAREIVPNINRLAAAVRGAGGTVAWIQASIKSDGPTGTLTEVCCESTARDAMMLNYKTIMVSDGNASRSDEEHMATLRVFLQHFGDVRTTDEVIELLGASTDSDAAGRAAE